MSHMPPSSSMIQEENFCMLQSDVDQKTGQHKKRETTYPGNIMQETFWTEISTVLCWLCCRTQIDPITRISCLSNSPHRTPLRNSFFFFFPYKAQSKVKSHFFSFSPQFFRWLCKYFFNVTVTHLWYQDCSAKKIWGLSLTYIRNWAPLSPFVPSHLRTPWFLEVLSDQ